MKFTCIKENLEKALSIAERFTGKNINLPILGNILLEVNENTLHLTATNLEYAVQISLSGKGLRNGKLSVPAKIFSSLVQSIKEDKIDLEEKQNNLLIKTDTRDTRINGTRTDDFPLLPKVKKSFSFFIEEGLLKRGLEKVLPASAISEFKPELNGVFFRVSSGKLYLAATDTFRLAEFVCPLSKKTENENFSFILPQRIAQEVSRILAEDEEIKITFGENQTLFEIGEIKIISRLIEGNFPEYTNIIPKDFSTSTFLKKDELINAIRSASIFASKIQDITFNISKNNFEVNSSNPEIGEHKIKLQAATTGKDVKISFNYRYLLDGLTVSDEEEVFFGCNLENSPSLVRGKSETTFLYVIMPIRLT